MNIIKISYIIFYIMMFNLSKSLRVNTYSMKKMRIFSTITNTPSASATTTLKSILTMPYDEFTHFIGGKGKANLVWEQLRLYGLDPLHENSKLSNKVKEKLRDQLQGMPIIPGSIATTTTANDNTTKLLIKLQDNQLIETVIIPSYRLDHSTLCISTQLGCDRRCSFCATGTMGLLRNLTPVEILIQILLAQEYVHNHNANVTSSGSSSSSGTTSSSSSSNNNITSITTTTLIPKITNIVFMGMGDAGGNLKSVTTALHTLLDTKQLQFSNNKICISTVGPRPEVFTDLLALPVQIGWSLHSVNDKVRKLLVPSTTYSTVEIRNNIMKHIIKKPYKKRVILIAFTLISGINDSIDDAKDIYEFLLPLNDICQKVIINLIPYNNIYASSSSDSGNNRGSSNDSSSTISSSGSSTGSSNTVINRKRMNSITASFERPADERIVAMMHYLREKGLFCSIRSTRGESESAACGMLVTQRQQRIRNIDIDSNHNMVRTDQ